MGNGIWSRIITQKYLKNRPLEDWIRARKFSIIGTSYFWNGFMRIMSWITCKLGWKVGDGRKICLGVDPMEGLDALFSLPKDLRDYLADYRISYLMQAQKHDDLSQGFNGWYSAMDLDLGGHWVVL